MSLYRPATVALLLAASLTACGSEDDGADEPTSTSTWNYPVTIENCGAEVTFDQAPERVVLLPTGGHLGNLNRPELQDSVMDSLEDLRQP